MIDAKDFSFGDDDVAQGYDNVIVPVVLEPWTRQLLEEHGPWTGRHVLDLATGTGIVARHLVKELGPDGKLTGIDINPQMMKLAERHCAEVDFDFREASAEALPLEDDSIDFAICQQGFQFFPDKPTAARELHRVLRPGERLCELLAAGLEIPVFGALCAALEDIDQHEISNTMRIPFDHMPADQLQASFESAGFSNMTVNRQELAFVLLGGPPHAVELAYASPIGPLLRALSEELQDAFRHRLLAHVEEISEDGITMGPMATHVLTAEKG